MSPTRLHITDLEQIPETLLEGQTFPRMSKVVICKALQDDNDIIATMQKKRIGSDVALPCRSRVASGYIYK